MKKAIVYTTAAALLTGAVACNKKAEMHQNPFLTAYDPPY